MKTSPESPKRFWTAVAIGAVAFAALWLTAVAPARTQVDSEQGKASKLSADIKRHFDPEGKPVELVEQSLRNEKQRLAGLERELEAVGIVLPPEYQPGPDRDPLYFQKRLSEFRQWIRQSGASDLFSGNRPLGFTEGVSEGVVQDSLMRLAVARRFVEVVRDSGVKAVLRVQQGGTPAHRNPDGAARIEKLPFRATVAADEQTLVRLVQEMSRPESFLSIESIVVEVRKPSSGAFEATFDLAGVRILEPVEPEPSGQTEPEAETDLETEPGVLIPTQPPPPREF